MDSYQAIYDAVRSRISGGNVGDAIESVARDAFDISYARSRIEEAFISAAHEMQRPSVLYKPEITADGTAWCALLGPDLQVGICGFGDTPAAAMAAFDEAFWKGKTPTAVRLASQVSA